MSYLRYLSLFAHTWCPTHIVLFFFVLYAASFSGLSIVDCPFGMLYCLYIRHKNTNVWDYSIYSDCMVCFWFSFSYSHRTLAVCFLP
jgi:hypothetical protein